jgi:histidyl-tRNA synthetase
MAGRTINAPKGVSEYFPPTSYAFEKVTATLSELAKNFGFAPIELPIFEETELFARGVGESTDVVQKEMYTFNDRGGRSITLRPEGTAGVMRSVIEHNLDRGQLPVKVFYSGPFFRAERPQKGRYRQFYQFGVEAIGYEDPEIDFEVIALADAGYRALGLKEFKLQITSLGDQESRLAHRKDLLAYYEKLNLDDETKARVAINPLRLFDDKRAEIIDLMKGAPLLKDYLSAEARIHFEKVCQLLESANIDYEINSRMVRGLDYYTKTTFEFISPNLGAQSGIGGGGRYDGLMSQLGGQELSGIGFGLGIDRILLALEQEEGESVVNENLLDLFLVPLGEAGKVKATQLAYQLRLMGLRVDIAYGNRALKGAMKAADKSGAKFSAVIGEDEIKAEKINLKAMMARSESQVALEAKSIAAILR